MRHDLVGHMALPRAIHHHAGRQRVGTGLRSNWPTPTSRFLHPRAISGSSGETSSTGLHCAPAAPWASGNRVSRSCPEIANGPPVWPPFTALTPIVKSARHSVISWLSRSLFHPFVENLVWIRPIFLVFSRQARPGDWFWSHCAIAWTSGAGKPEASRPPTAGLLTDRSEWWWSSPLPAESVRRAALQPMMSPPFEIIRRLDQPVRDFAKAPPSEAASNAGLSPSVSCEPLRWNVTLPWSRQFGGGPGRIELVIRG